MINLSNSNLGKFMPLPCVEDTIEFDLNNISAIIRREIWIKDGMD